MVKTSRALLLLSVCFHGTSPFAQDAQGTFLGTLRIEAPDAQALLGNDEITEEELEDRNAETLQGVFAGESSISGSGGAAIAQKVFVNGIEESLLSVTIDGARQNKSAFHHTGNVLLDPALLKSVEISEGIAPADAGPGALAGGIAYTTKDARDFLEDGETFGGRLSFGVNSNGEALRSTLTLFGQQENFDWLLSSTRALGDSYEGGDAAIVPGTEPDLTDFIGKFGYTSTTGKRLSFSASRTEDTGLRQAQAGPGGILFTRPDFAEVVGTANTLIPGFSRRTSYTLTYEDLNADGGFSPTAQLTYNEQEIDASGVEGINTSLSGKLENEWALSNGTLTTGVDFFFDTAEGQGNGPGPFASSGKEELLSFGVYAQSRQDLSDVLSVSYGARADWQSFDLADGTTVEDAGISVNGAIDFVLTDSLTLNAGVSSSWGGYELGEAALINFGTSWTYVGLTASRANAARLGVRYENGPWDASSAVFYTEVNDINAVLPSGGNRGATSDLVSKGFDGSLRYAMDRGFAALNYTYADVTLNADTIGSTAYYLGRPVGHVIALEAGYDLNDNWRIGGSAEITLDNDDTAPLELEGYEVVNAYARYRPAAIEDFEVRLDVRNLFDETYVARSSDGSTLTTVVPLNEPGRSIALTASYRF